MASPSTSQQSLVGPVCLPLLKFSYATVPMDSVAPVPWTHISNKNNLFAIFETSRTRRSDWSVEEKQKFKILRDPEVMEELDLEILAGEAQQAIAVSKDAHQHNRDQYVAVIVKVPVIAMKYPMTGGQVRRFQIRFASDENYYDAMKLLSRAQVPTIEAGTFPQRPQTAISAGTSNNAGNLQVDNRPVSAAANFCAENISNSTFSPEVTTKGAHRPETAVSSLMPPPPHFASPVKLGLVDSQCVRSQTDAGRAFKTETANSSTGADARPGGLCLDKRPGTTINLYTPRPSAAAVTTSQHFSQLLPPKRDLPFEKSNPGSRSSSSRVLRSARKDSAEPEATLLKPETVSTKPQKTHDCKSATSSSQTSTEKRKRSSVKSSKASDTVRATKKGRTARTKPAKGTREDSPLPSIEEVLEDQKPREVQEGKNVDTQDLLFRPEQVHSSGLHVSAARTILRLKATSFEEPKSSVNAPIVSRAEIPGSSADAAAISPTKTSASLFPSTPASQMIKASTPSAPVVQHTIDTAPAPASEDNLFSTVADTYSLLMRFPTFANSDPKLASWGALPEHQQMEALKNFMCEQYDDKTGNFQQLCKMMERTWEASIVWPELYKGSSGV